MLQNLHINFNFHEGYFLIKSHHLETNNVPKTILRKITLQKYHLLWYEIKILLMYGNKTKYIFTSSSFFEIFGFTLTSSINNT